VSEQTGFERAWRQKLSRAVEEKAGGGIRRRVMEGSEDLGAGADRQTVIAWTQQAMERLVEAVEPARRHAIMTSCACQYPVDALQGARKAYAETGSIEAAHAVLQEMFRGFLLDVLGLNDQAAEDVIGRGWGLAGVVEGSTVIATKIPKSGNLAAYLQESDPQRKRQLFCHCPRVRDVLAVSESPWPSEVAKTYCMCGAGFYKGIWEEIVQAPVRVELLESVLKGDDVCKVAVHLPHAAS
jgi:hypothetical protein